jgi:spermidine/putrescine transport system substrate-binding protein
MKRVLSVLALLAVIIAPLALNELFQGKRTLYLYMWSAYIKPELIERFQEEHNCRVIIDTYDSNEAMYTKLKFGGSGYDIIFPSNYFLDLMAEQGMLLPIQEGLLPNIAYVDWGFLHRFGLSKTLNGIPYMASFSGLAWRKDRLDRAPESWSIFGTPELKGRMTMLNDMRETLGAGLLYLGYSANTTSPEEVAKAGRLICRWKHYLAKLESEQYKNGIANAEYLVVHGYSGDCLQVARVSNDVAFSYPKEGSIVAVDYAAIMKTSHDPLLAHAFLNFLLDPQVAAENIEFTSYRCVNTGARKLLPENLRNSLFLYPELAGAVHFECLFSVGDARPAYIKAWDEVKAAS